jgi:hypothetical protein
MSRKLTPEASNLAAGSGDDFFCLAIYKIRHPSLDALGTGGRGSAAGPTY